MYAYETSAAPSELCAAILATGLYAVLAAALSFAQALHGFHCMVPGIVVL